MKRLFLVLALALLISGCARVVQEGDTVQVTYTGAYTNGTVFDTNDIAKGATHIEPLVTRVGAHLVVAGFEQALIGMKEGATKTVLVKAAEAYGGYDPKKAVTVPIELRLPLEVNIDRRVLIPLEKLQGENLTPGNNITTDSFSYTVLTTNETHAKLYLRGAQSNRLRLGTNPWQSVEVRASNEVVTFRHLIEMNGTYDLQWGPYAVTQLNATTATFISTFKPGSTYRTANGIGRVRESGKNAYLLDYNHPLAGENLVFTIRVDAIN